MNFETQPVQHPPAGTGQRRAGWPILAAVALGGVLAGGGAVYLLLGSRGGQPATARAEKKGPRYTCPMHPTIVQDHPGECPICGMQLVPMQEGGGAKGERTIAFYRSPMDPKQTSPVPRKDEMGMDYLPVYEDEVHGGGAVEGLATVNIDPARQQLIGLTTAEVRRGAAGGSRRTVGRVQVDPTRVRRINVKVGGYVERIFVDFVGKPVRRGQPLFSLYSPELVSAQNEYLLALQTRKALSGGGQVASDGEALVASARRKLELWDVPESEIERLERGGQAAKGLTFVSPISGVVTAKNVVEGARIAAGDTPYEVTDLGEVWVMADAYETDLAQVRVGMAATLTLQAYPGRVFDGRVAFIDPLLDPKTRTAKVHVHFPNPRGDLKPEMYGEVVLRSPERQGLIIPLDAVIHTGTKNVVFVDLGEGKFQPREVQLGDASGDQVEVAKGLELGEKVVTRANFLVDSESRLRASLAAIGGK
ncbi:MAG TPA: efflux RND transporter periplasmic adaptor subunit [Anaeromyxobacteraceae bacterium]|nr:efflux RND transporter periplasmic adaptor subunit [Anaeromyxobacteraceae bacterium]